MTQEEFEAAYIRTHPQAKFGGTHVAMPCHCSEIEGEHWAAIRNTEEAIQAHLEDEELFVEERSDGQDS